jgi:hypothetical protein
MDGLELYTDKLDLAAPDRCDLTLSDFHELSRAVAALKDLGCSQRTPRRWRNRNAVLHASYTLVAGTSDCRRLRLGGGSNADLSPLPVLGEVSHP